MSDAKDAVAMAKKVLRKEMLNIIKQISQEQIIRETAHVVKQVFENEAFKNARRVSVYVNLNEGEIRTEEIIERILSEGKACFIPCFQPKATDMKMVRLESIEEYQSLPSTIWGIRQPPADQPREDALQSDTGLDLVLLPGVAFSEDGRRLGHGRGYYDRFLIAHQTKYGRLPKTIGLALRGQMRSDIPVTERDVPLDLVFHG